MEMDNNSSICIFGLSLLQYLKLIFNLNEVVGTGGRERYGKRESKMAGWGSEMQNASSCHLVCIRIPKEQEREMIYIFDLHQRLLSNQANKNLHLVWKTIDVSSLYTNIP